MEINLKVKMENGENEAVNLHKFIKAHNIQGISSKVKEKPAKKGQMGGGLTDIVSLTVSSGIMATVVTSLFAVIQKFIAARKGEIELSFQCPNNGKKFSQKFNYKSTKERDEIQAAFEKKYKNACKETPEIIIAHR